MDPLDRLSYLRGIFYTSNQSLGQRTMPLTRQSSDAGYELYKENVMWQYGVVLFIGFEPCRAATTTTGARRASLSPEPNPSTRPATPRTLPG